MDREDDNASEQQAGAGGQAHTDMDPEAVEAELRDLRRYQVSGMTTVAWLSRSARISSV